MVTRRLSARLRLAVIAALVLAAAGCGGDDGPDNPLCPLIGNRGPALPDGGDFLLVADGLGEDWLAAPLDGSPFEPLPARGLTGPAPNDLEVSSGRMFLVNSGDNTVSRVDLGTGVADGCLLTGDNTGPWELELDPADPDRGWLTTFLSGEVLELDLAAMKVLRRRTVGAGAEGLVVEADRLVVTLTGYDGEAGAFLDGTVVVLRKSDLGELARLAVPPTPSSPSEAPTAGSRSSAPATTAT